MHDNNNTDSAVGLNWNSSDLNKEPKLDLFETDEFYSIIISCVYMWSCISAVSSALETNLSPDQLCVPAPLRHAPLVTSGGDAPRTVGSCVAKSSVLPRNWDL